MRCNDELRLRIGPLLDGELAAAERDELAAHIAGCADCARYRRELATLRAEVRQVREAAPAGLVDRLRASLELEAAESRGEAGLPPARPALAALIRQRIAQHVRLYARPVLALLLVAVLSAATALWWADRAAVRQDLAHDVLAAHMRALLQDNAVQVASLDTHTVKPWFAGRLDYTPVVKDLSGDGFKLLGGRLDYVDGRRVAALVYMRRLHKISLFVWPARSGGAMASHQRLEGYNIVSWTASNMTFWAISDVDPTELERLAALGW